MNNQPSKNPLERDITKEEICIRGLENIPISDVEVNDGERIEFSCSTPTKIQSLERSLTQWSPKIHDVVSIVEEIVESDDERYCNTNKNEHNSSEKKIIDDHTVFINEDAVKQEEFADENTEDNFTAETNKNFKQNEEELNISFDENKVKREYNISKDVCIKLEKINPKVLTNGQLSTLIHNYTVSSRNRSNSNLRINNPSTSKSHSKKSSINKKISQDNQHSAKTQENISQSNKKKQSSNQAQSKKNTRHSLRLSGRSPEMKIVLDELSYTTRSGKKRIYEEPKSRSMNDSLSSRNESSKDFNADLINNYSMKKEPETDIRLRTRSSSPSAYRKHVNMMYICQCCNQKYFSLEHIKMHVRTHFSNSVTS